MSNKEQGKAECLPLDTFEELLNFVPEIVEPEDLKRIDRSGPFKFDNISGTDFEVRRCPNSPKTLVCHDMKGGYLEDRFRDGCYTVLEEPYRFIHWSLIDIFVYFSHHFITIPPRQWIRAAHRNGVQILGTVITEFKPGESVCAQFLKDEDSVDQFVQSLTKLSRDLNLDGWLINIENKLSPDQVGLMVKLLKDLTASMRQLNANSCVIWYDAVTIDGKLDWQNELNAKNKIFFDACDAIFLNYTWKPENLDKSIISLSGEDRAFDVFVGVDVFGRGCIGGGGFQCKQPISIIREKNLSAAIFAPGWTHECKSKDVLNPTYPCREYKFWKLIRPFLFVRGPLVDEKSPIFQTYFCPGFGQNFEDESWWLNLICQDFQPSLLAHPHIAGDEEDQPVEPFSVFNQSDQDVLSDSDKLSFGLTLEKKCRNAEWRIGKLKNVFPLFVAHIRSAGKKILFSMTTQSGKRPTLYIRTFVDDGDAENNKFVRLKKGNVEENVLDVNDSEKLSKFEEFIFSYESEDKNEVVDFVGIGVDDDDVTKMIIKSFKIWLI